jgi:hypothetical protein
MVMWSSCAVFRHMHNVMAEAPDLRFPSSQPCSSAYRCIAILVLRACNWRGLGNKSVQCTCFFRERGCFVAVSVSCSGKGKRLLDSFLLKCDVESHGCIAFVTLPHCAYEWAAADLAFSGSTSALQR